MPMPLLTSIRDLNDLKEMRGNALKNASLQFTPNSLEMNYIKTQQLTINEFVRRFLGDLHR